MRDESIGYGPKVESQFVHSQKYILTQLIPEKVRELRNLMFTGTKDEAQRRADATGRPVYWSRVAADDEQFGVDYELVNPTGVTTDFSDEAGEIHQIIFAWVQMVAQNEHEKLNATELVTNYDVDGGTRVTYSEAFGSDYTLSNYYYLPGILAASYFDESGKDMAITATSIVGVKVVQFILNAIYKNHVNESTTTSGTSADPESQGGFETAVNFCGSTFKFSLLPVMEYSVKDLSGESKSFSRKESFSIVMDKRSHLNFDLYRVQTDAASVQAAGLLDVFTNQNFYDGVEYVEEHLRRGNSLPDIRYSRGYVYRTRGGASCNPWEDERRTLFYDEGRILDERTKKIQNPKITLDRQSVSGVAVGDPARFKVYLANDSELPEAATGSLCLYNLFLEEGSNPHGAKIYVDGTPLGSAGIHVYLNPGQVVQKTIEVYAGDEFDYEGLQLALYSPNDRAHVYDVVSFDVHYLRMAGAVNIASPGDKWIMNTDAPWNDRLGWFLPITIDGFDKHQKNFDHIEFQYKESQRGEEFWTNLCSFYADSTLMAQANGVREMIPENGNINTQFYGEGTVMEKAYDLRAVLCCRDGNSLLTSASKILSGVKDTRRPQLFGSPEPVSGIVKQGEDIVFNFSEDIEYNYLNAITNFEVKGEVNNDNVVETVSVQFMEQASVESEAQRNFSGKDLTIDLMVRPDETGRDMPLFSHGTNGKKLQLWLTDDLRLKGVVDDQTFTSTEPIEKDCFTQVAMSISQADGTLSFYNGGKEIGTFELTAPYNGTGTLIFGRTNETDRTKSHYYQGRMMEVRLWYRSMSGGQIGTTYGNKRLTGYEMGLVDYYPMNEGSGRYVLDHTQGANAQLIGASWAMPHGLALHLDGEAPGVALTQNALNRTSEQDYTLMFWFKTDDEGRGVLVSNGAGSKNEVGAENLFNIGFETGKLMYRSNGMDVEVPGNYSDGQWHHYAMTVNRAFNVVNIYVDQELRTTFAADSLGGISGGHPLIGAALMDRVNDEGHVLTTDTRQWLKGHIDELCFFAQALPQTLVKSYSTKSPRGDEAGLLTYLSFDRQERQKDNDIVLVPYPYSKKIYKDNNGDVCYELDPLTQEVTTTPVRDYVFVDTIDKIMSHIDGTTAAPVVPYEELRNLSFGFVGEGHKLLVHVNEPNARLNRRNIYVTVRDVEDKNGNAMASPATACYYVTNSSLQWMENRKKETALYGTGSIIGLDIINTSASSHTYTIQNCPKWLTLDKYTDVIAPQREATLVATVSKDLNVGTYDEIIYLTDEEGMSEPLYLSMTVEVMKPDWAWNVPSDLLETSMNIAGQVYVNDEIDIDTRDIVGVFDRHNVCHGFANVSYSALTGESGLYLTVYDHKKQSNKDTTALFFKLWQYTTGRELMLTANGQSTMTFKSDTIIGIDTPVRFDGGETYVQTFDLKAGWNWISLNVISKSLTDLNNLLDGLPWQEGDVVTDMNSSVILTYINNGWLASGHLKETVISPTNAYAIKVQRDTQIPVGGHIIKDEKDRTVTLKNGWNGIGYTPTLNLSVETALSDYYDKAEPGDVIKSQDEFAYFTVSGGVGRWKGSLEYMKPGKGYMLLRKANSEASFKYPFYEPGSTFLDEWTVGGNRAAAPMRGRHTMSVTAVVEGFDVEEGDHLVAYAGGKMVGETTMVLPETAMKSAEEATMKSADEPLTTGGVFFLSIAGEEQTGIWFAIEREGEIVASTHEVMDFHANAVVGSPDEPTAIRFVRADSEDGKWYTTGGVMLPKRPTQKGIYIYKGKKIVIK